MHIELPFPTKWYVVTYGTNGHTTITQTVLTGDTIVYGPASYTECSTYIRKHAHAH